MIKNLEQLKLHDLLGFRQAVTQITRIDDDSFDLSETIFHFLSSNLNSCDYYNTDSHTFDTDDIFLFIIHVNIRSLNQNFDILYEFLQTFVILPDIVCLSETCIKGKSFINTDIPEYDFVHFDSPTNTGGVVYISSKLSHNIVHDEEKDLNGCENI